MDNIREYIISFTQELSKDLPQSYVPPSEGAKSKTEMVIAASLFKNTRGYIERVVMQINGSYEQGWYDSCAVMIRRLLETLIIEVFEKHKIADKIKNPKTNDFCYLSDLITITLSEASWNLSRNTKQVMPKLKNIGDLSAHSRRYNAHRSDIDNIIQDLRIVAQELIYLAGLK
ncbi:MAG: DUF4145 domain-containing protein [Bacillota bacterium]